MFEALSTLINSGSYDLADITHRIENAYGLGYLNEDQFSQLLQSAQSNANPDSQMPDLVTRMGNLELRVGELEKKFSGSSESSEDAWPLYVEPQSKDQLYNKDSKITWTDGCHYICLKNNVKYGPDLEPDKWQKVEQDDAATVNTDGTSETA